MSDWVAAEILLTAAVLALAMPREDGFVIPERRDWLGWARRLRPGARRQREEEAGAEADRYVTDLRTDQDQPLMTIRTDQLPVMSRVWRGPQVSPPSGQKPPWKTAENPAWSAPGSPGPPPVPPRPADRPRRRAPGDPPTVVIEIMRPFVEGDLGRYLAELPSYPDDESGDSLFIARSVLADGPAALGAPDDNRAPDDVDRHRAEEGDLEPYQRQVGDPEVDVQDRREQAPGDRQLQQDGVPSPARAVPGPEEARDRREKQ